MPRCVFCKEDFNLLAINRHEKTCESRPKSQNDDDEIPQVVEINGLGQQRFFEIVLGLQEQLKAEFQAEDVKKFNQFVYECAAQMLEAEQLLAQARTISYNFLVNLCQLQTDIEADVLRKPDALTHYQKLSKDQPALKKILEKFYPTGRG